ncbi:hypothetical protein D3C76_1444930 [compost metagenome]
MPPQARDDTGALGAVKTLQIALQVITGVATRAATRQSQAHVNQWTQHLFAEVAGHAAGRDVPAFLIPVGIIELDQEAPVIAFFVASTRQNLQP